MIIYLKHILLALIIISLESSLLFKKTFNLYTNPDIFLVYIFWLSLYDREDTALITALFGGILLDLLMPSESIINVLIYLSLTLITLKLKEKFLISNIFMKFLIITAISMYIILLNILYNFILSKVLVLDVMTYLFYWISNLVLIYLVYYLREFLMFRYDKV